MGRCERANTGRLIAVPANRYSRTSSLLLASLCGLLALALCRSLWWFAAVAVALLSALHYAGRESVRRPQATRSPQRFFPLSMGTLVSLVLYAALASSVLLTMRAALGWLDAPSVSLGQTQLPAHLQGSFPDFFYDKTEVRLALFELLLLMVMTAPVFVQSARYWARRRETPFVLHPMSAMFAILLVLASVYLPPYRINVDHWFPFVAAATGIRHGVWPYLSGFQSGYGLLCPAFLAVWLSAFGLSVLSLSGIIMLSNLVAGTATFALIRRLTGSRTLALLGALYPLQGIDNLALTGTRMFAVSSSFRAPVQITLGALLLYLSLRDRRGRLWPGFLFGLTVLWNPPFGAFAATGFLFAHGYVILHAAGEERASRLRTVLAMFAGIGLPPAMIWAWGSTILSSPAEIYDALSATGSLHLLGFGNLAQQFDPIAIVAFMVGGLYLALVLRRWSQSRRLTSRYLFVGASLIAACPYFMYALGRSDTLHYLPAYWVLMPCVTLLVSGFVRLLSMRPNLTALTHGAVPRSARVTTSTWLIVLIACAYLWGAFPLDRVFSTNNFATSHMLAHYKWHLECAASNACEKETEPSLRNQLKRANQPMLEAGLLTFSPSLIAACRDGLVVLSYADAWIYATAGCFSPIHIPSVSFLTTGSEFERIVGQLEVREYVLFDHVKNVYADWRGGMLQELKARLIEQGYTETPGCGRFSVLSKVNPAPLLRKLCG